MPQVVAFRAGDAAGMPIHSAAGSQERLPAAGCVVRAAGGINGGNTTGSGHYRSYRHGEQEEFACRTPKGGLLTVGQVRGAVVALSWRRGTGDLAAVKQGCRAPVEPRLGTNGLVP
jgi:hypothetical protein